MDAWRDQQSAQPYSYTSLPSNANDTVIEGCTRRRRSSCCCATLTAALLILLVGAAALLWTETTTPTLETRRQVTSAATSRGPAQGVSEKTSSAGVPQLLDRPGEVEQTRNSYPWPDAALHWQRTAFHFQPEKNWMNDPNGPMFYKGWYHLFYQYYPDAAMWGPNMTWGHAVSRDLIRWLHLPLAMVGNEWYDFYGTWSGSVTFLPDGLPVVLYTGKTTDGVQVQNLAFPLDPSDPFLRHWSKGASNPVLYPPPGIGINDFRDPTTAWFNPDDSTWHLAIGSKDSSHAGIALLYKTKDFTNFELVPELLHRVEETGMWECVDFYPVAINGPAAARGVDASKVGDEEVKHVLKASMDDERHDYYALGRLDLAGKKMWVPDEPEKDVGFGLRYDWGKFYASKTFYDQKKRRRVLWGWIGETDAERDDLQKGWASVQSVPRTVLYDEKTGSNLMQWPVEEVETLRVDSTVFHNITVYPGSVFHLNITHKADQLDILAEFQISKEALETVVEADVLYNCSTGGGAAGRGMLGPFGLIVLADKQLREQTATYLYISRSADGGTGLRTHFCQDETRSSMANDVVKRVVGDIVPVLDGETLSLRVLVDHSVVESFAQSGRTCITSRVYPIQAIDGATTVHLFNNATVAAVAATSVTVWRMDSSRNHRYTIEDLSRFG